MQLTNITLETNRQTVHAAAALSGYETALIMWCGLGSTSLSFLHFLQTAQANEVDVIAIDPPGHGESPAWNGDLTPSDSASIWTTLIKYVKQSGAKRIFIGGHSYGAFTALMALTEVHQDIGGIVLLDGGYIDYGAVYNRDEAIAGAKAYLASQRFASWDEYLKSERDHARHWDETIEAILCANMKEADGEIVPKLDLDAGIQAQDLLAHFRLDDVPESNLPVLLVRSTKPESLRADREQGTGRLKAKLTNLRVVDVQSGHDLVVENPHDTMAAVWSFIHSR